MQLLVRMQRFRKVQIVLRDSVENGPNDFAKRSVRNKQCSKTIVGDMSPIEELEIAKTYLTDNLD